MFGKFLCLFFFILSSISLSYAGPFEDIQKAVENGDKDTEFTMAFSDGYEQKVKGPFELIKSDVTYRCPCADYTIVFTDENGRQERKIHHKQFGGRVEYYSKDGSSKYELSSVKESNGEASKGGCHGVGELKKLVVRTKKVLPKDQKMCPKNGVTTCMGEKMLKCEGRLKCRGDKKFPDGEFDVYCMASDSDGCPSPYKCAEDEAFDKYIAEAKADGAKIIEDKNSTTRGK
ncbi:MAG: hypothetical protein CME70_16025 [Halobacteriovorax sp.]|nr:hypothetical protein [Halobacteriovorax sp.]|tara:strand:+ start:68881 stop:69573 length:693 start_codon:yes stop_codon:yes gene_type:complete